MNKKDYFRSISVLRESFLRNNQLRVQHSHRIWMASFVWADPSSVELIKDIEKQLGMKIPEDLSVFLTTVSNGAILYRNIEDAMTGYSLYSIDEYLEKQERWRRSLGELWLPQFLAIGEITSENRPILFDSSTPTKDGTSCKLMEGNPYDPVKYWLKLSDSFHEWIDHLVSAQGAQYWLWH